MRLSSFDGAGDGEYSGSNFVEISQIFVMRDAFFLRTGLFDRILSVYFSHPRSYNQHCRTSYMLHQLLN